MGLSETDADYVGLLGSLATLGEALKGTQVTSRQRPAETLFTKFFAHACSALSLSRGTTVEELGIGFFDPSSINVICRAALESLLVLHYLFVEPETEDEREFRYRCWVISGLREVEGLPERLIQDVESLREAIQRNLDALEGTARFQELTHKVKKRVKSGEKWRFKGWKCMAKSAGFNEMDATTVYGYLCGHAHSGYFSVTQLGQAQTAEDQKTLFRGMTEVLKPAMALMVSCLTRVFPQVSDALTRNQKALVEEWLVIESHGDGECRS